MQQYTSTDEPIEIRRVVVLYEGYVLKESTFGWNKRKMLLTGSSIFFYETQERDSEMPIKSTTEVTYADNIRSKDFVLTITTEKKNYIICYKHSTSWKEVRRLYYTNSKAR